MATELNKPKDKLLFYGRISSTEQLGNTSLDNQLYRCQLRAEDKSAEIINCEDSSAKEQFDGSVLFRPGLFRVLEQLKCLHCEPREMPIGAVSTNYLLEPCRCGKMAGADGLIVHSLDRLSRSTNDLIFIMNDIIRKLNKRLIVVNGDFEFDTKTPTGNLVFGLFALLAQFEKDSLKDKMKTAKEAAARQGRHVNGVAPFGFAIRHKQRVYSKGELVEVLPPQLIPLEPEVVVIKDILVLYYMKWSMRQIVDYLNQNYNPPRRAKSWGLKGVFRIIHGPEAQIHAKPVQDAYIAWHKECQAQAMAELGKGASYRPLLLKGRKPAVTMNYVGAIPDDNDFGALA